MRSTKRIDFWVSAMKITNLPIDPGPAAWNSILPKDQIRAELTEHTRADWLVIGAGFAGLSAAHRLRNLHPNDRIIVLDAVGIAEGPAGRNSGFMIDLPHDLSSNDYGGESSRDMDETRANRHGISIAKSMADEFEMLPEAIALSGKINGAASASGHKHNLDYAKHLTEMGETYSLLSAQDMRAITGIDYYQGGLFTPGTAVIQPALFIRSLVTGLTKKGVEIYPHSPVISLVRVHDWIAQTPKGQITAPKVIIAVNGHLNSFGHAKRQLLHVFTYATMTEQLGVDECRRLGGERNWGITPAHPAGSTVRRISGIGGNRLVVRNRFTMNPSLTITDNKLARIAKSQRRSFAKRFNKFPNLRTEYTWAGRLCLSRNNVSVFGEIDTGLYSACCHNGLGTAKGTFFGEMAADLASGMDNPFLPYAMGQEPAQTIPPEPIAQLGANAFIKWQEMKAGNEL